MKLNKDLEEKRRRKREAKAKEAPTELTEEVKRVLLELSSIQMRPLNVPLLYQSLITSSFFFFDFNTDTRFVKAY